MIRDIECALCEKIFECKGKEEPRPCLYFEERKNNDSIYNSNSTNYKKESSTNHPS